MPKDQVNERSWGDSLPPYGVMPTLANPGPLPQQTPSHWRGPDFQVWLNAQLDLIAELLWPRCNEAGKSWQGAAEATMMKLTEEDLGLLRELRAPSPDRPIDLPPDVAGRHAACPRQLSFFLTEDFGEVARPPIDPNTILAMYQPKANPELIATQTSSVMGQQMQAKTPVSMIYRFKKELQRPRPYQAAFLLLPENERFNHEGARSALHPAMISGHCLQGLGFLMAFAERMIVNRSVIEPHWAALARYYTDFGDRRVLAGVHYPSDNLSSWIVALNLCEHVVHRDAAKETRKLIGEAIANSFVYGKIKEKVKDGSAYKPAWDHLQTLLRPR